MGLSFRPKVNNCLSLVFTVVSNLVFTRFDPSQSTLIAEKDGGPHLGIRWLLLSGLSTCPVSVPLFPKGPRAAGKPPLCSHTRLDHCLLPLLLPGFISTMHSWPSPDCSSDSSLPVSSGEPPPSACPPCPLSDSSTFYPILCWEGHLSFGLSFPPLHVSKGPPFSFKGTDIHRETQLWLVPAGMVRKCSSSARGAYILVEEKVTIRHIKGYQVEWLQKYAGVFLSDFPSTLWILRAGPGGPSKECSRGGSLGRNEQLQGVFTGRLTIIPVFPALEDVKGIRANFTCLSRWNIFSPRRTSRWHFQRWNEVFPLIGKSVLVHTDRHIPTNVFCLPMTHHLRQFPARYVENDGSVLQVFIPIKCYGMWSWTNVCSQCLIKSPIRSSK